MAQDYDTVDRREHGPSLRRYQETLVVEVVDVLQNADVDVENEPRVARCLLDDRDERRLVGLIEHGAVAIVDDRLFRKLLRTDVETYEGHQPVDTLNFMTETDEGSARSFVNRCGEVFAWIHPQYRWATK